MKILIFFVLIWIALEIRNLGDWIKDIAYSFENLKTVYLKRKDNK